MTGTALAREVGGGAGGWWESLWGCCETNAKGMDYTLSMAPHMQRVPPLRHAHSRADESVPHHGAGPPPSSPDAPPTSASSYRSTQGVSPDRGGGDDKHIDALGGKVGPPPSVPGLRLQIPTGPGGESASPSHGVTPTASSSPCFLPLVGDHRKDVRTGVWLQDSASLQKGDLRELNQKAAKLKVQAEPLQRKRDQLEDRLHQLMVMRDADGIDKTQKELRITRDQCADVETRISHLSRKIEGLKMNGGQVMDRTKMHLGRIDDFYDRKTGGRVADKMKVEEVVRRAGSSYFSFEENQKKKIHDRDKVDKDMYGAA
eukprot:CAMPEP_0173467994 /NCGR_PEP_ID=MMETSP1357-20121228/76079_1 /TAXON_ID=77926 /ORGANISM="Hemiselmis rufescens, Strain PCC563" /LENGTH=315 /DNA_ID=CAMNT_0014436177 /DNA_START=182 /DNA_END=1126 /DNA_ORIENTATION=-